MIRASYLNKPSLSLSKIFSSMTPQVYILTYIYTIHIHLQCVYNNLWDIYDEASPLNQGKVIISIHICVYIIMYTIYTIHTHLYIYISHNTIYSNLTVYSNLWVRYDETSSIKEKGDNIYTYLRIHYYVYNLYNPYTSIYLYIS